MLVILDYYYIYCLTLLLLLWVLSLTSEHWTAVVVICMQVFCHILFIMSLTWLDFLTTWYLCYYHSIILI